MRQMFNVLTTADTSSIRTGTYNGLEHRIVPLVAIVEGVLHSANSEHPELALAAEFGKHPQGWNGRPVVMNHPKVNGSFVSAGQPEILEEWSYGLLFNTRVEDSKLKTEAWLDVGKINSAGGEIQEILSSIENGGLVEVSTGLYASVDQQNGRFNSDTYEGIWRSISPDHLALLSAGTIGACSIEDGCGIPRLNNVRQSAPVQTNSDCDAGCTDCAECRDQANQESTMDTPEQEQLRIDKRAALLTELCDGLFTNEVPSDLPVDSVRSLLLSALTERYPEDLYTIHTFTTGQVVFELWSTMDKFALNYSIANDKAALDEGEPTKINIINRIVAALDGSDANTEAADAAQTSEEDTIMDNENATDGAPTGVEAEVEDAAIVTDPIVADPAIAEPAANAAPISVEAYLNSAPAEIRESLTAGLKLHAERKASLVGKLLANERNTFPEEMLNSFDIEMLERVSTLANIPTFEGAAPVSPSVNAVDSQAAPIAAQAFPLTLVE